MNTAINSLSETIEHILNDPRSRMRCAPAASYIIVGKGSDPTREMTATCATDGCETAIRFTEVAHGVNDPHVRSFLIADRGEFLMSEVGNTIPVRPGNKYYSALLSIVRGWSMEARQQYRKAA